MNGILIASASVAIAVKKKRGQIPASTYLSFETYQLRLEKKYHDIKKPTRFSASLLIEMCHQNMAITK